MPSLIFRHSLLAFLAFLQACALPISTPLVARGTNATLAPPSSYDSGNLVAEEHLHPTDDSARPPDLLYGLDAHPLDSLAQQQAQAPWFCW